MKKILIFFILCLFINVAYSQSKKAFNQSIGLKINHTLNYHIIPYSAEYYYGTSGLQIDYNRLIKGEKHFIGTGIGIQFAVFTSQREVDSSILNMLEEHQKIIDFNSLLVIPIHYIYKPKPWLVLSTGFNNKIPIKGKTYNMGSLIYEEKGIPDYRKYILEYHAGVGVEVGIKRVKLRVETIFNRSIVPWEYYDIRGNLGLFYHFR